MLEGQIIPGGKKWVQYAEKIAEGMNADPQRKNEETVMRIIISIEDRNTWKFLVKSFDECFPLDLGRTAHPFHYD